MEPYNPSKSFIQMKLEGNLLDRLAEEGIPLTRALKYFRDNPEGPASETLNLATDETVPFKWQLRTGNATPASLAEEAVLWFTPVKGHRKKVRTMPDGTPNLKDLGAWYDSKLSQLDRVEGEIMRRDPNLGVEGLNEEIARKEFDYNFDEELLSSPERRKYYGYPDDPWSLQKLKGSLTDIGKEIMDLRAKRDLKAIDALDYNGMTHKDYIDKFGTMLEDDDRMPYLDRQIRNEYGKGLTEDEISALLQRAWNEGGGMSPKEIQEYIDNYH